jgi:RNA polymerase sigma-70 factor, ECF subfamily
MRQDAANGPTSSTSPTWSDEELVAAILRGDRARYAELVGRYQGRLVNFLNRLLRNAEDAHDLAQEVFLKVYQALDRFDPRYRFSTWIFRVAQNAAIDQIRRQRLRLVPMTREGGDGEDREWDFPSADPTPYADLRNRERGDAIAEAIAGLPWEYRELILLRHYGELSYDEIATLKKMPLGTVKNKLFRGRQMLKEKLADFLTD